MTEAQKMAQQLNGQLDTLKTGALCFWGNWFGRPRDNIHRIVSCEADGEVLKIHFDEGEVLSVTAPRGLKADNRTFRIEQANKVRWDRHFYGRPKTNENIYFEEFTNAAGVITTRTNVDWYKIVLQGDARKPAVEMD